MCTYRTLGNEEKGILWKCIDQKRHYWPRGVHGDGINGYFRSKNIGYAGCLIGEWDEAEFNFFFKVLLQYYYDVNLFGFDCGGRSEGR